MRNKTFLLTVIFLAIAFFVKAADRHYYTSDKMSSGFVTCIEQDRDGFLWVGTSYGLNRFDGYRFTAYFSKNDDEQTLQGNAISTMYTDKSCRLWVGCVHGLSLYDSAGTTPRGARSPSPRGGLCQDGVRPPCS